MDLSMVRRSNNRGPTRVAMHSVEGFGKTTLACYFPKPLIIGPERAVPRDLGFEVDTARPEDWLDYFDLIHALTNDRHDYQSLWIDTVDWVEPQIHRFVCQRDSERQTEMNPKSRKLESIEDYGFGKGFLVAEEEFRKLLGALDVLQAKRGMHVGMLMHSAVRTFKNPSGPDFDRWEPKCHARVARVVVEWAENVLFGFFRVDAAKISEDKERNKMAPDKARAKGISTGERIIGAQQSAMYDAKNRVRMPAEMVYTDPNEVVSLLLGEHLKDPRNAEPLAQRTSKPDAEPYDDRQRGGGLAYARREQPREVTMQMPTSDQRFSDPPPVPAHHPDRVDDERRRQQDAFDRATSRPQSERPGNTEARTWTEPKRPDPAPEQPRDASGALMAQLQAARANAHKFGGDRYLSAVNSWITKADGDPAKLKKIIERVEKDCAAHTQQAAG